jgi:hypothetical protein
MSSWCGRKKSVIGWPGRTASMFIAAPISRGWGLVPVEVPDAGDGHDDAQGRGDPLCIDRGEAQPAPGRPAREQEDRQVKPKSASCHHHTHEPRHQLTVRRGHHEDEGAEEEKDDHEQKGGCRRGTPTPAVNPEWGRGEWSAVAPWLPKAEKVGSDPWRQVSTAVCKFGPATPELTGN